MATADHPRLEEPYEPELVARVISHYCTGKWILRLKSNFGLENKDNTKQVRKEKKDKAANYSSD